MTTATVPVALAEARQRAALLEYLLTEEAAAHSYAEIGSRFGVAWYTVAFMARKLNLPQRKRGRHAGQKSDLTAAAKGYHNGTLREYVREHATTMTDSEIAAATGASRERARQLRKALGFAPSRAKRCQNGHIYAEVGKRLLPRGAEVCAACHPEPTRKQLTDTCENCGETFTLMGRDRDRYLQNRRTFPNLRRFCLSCGKAARRDGHGLRQWHAQRKELGIPYTMPRRTHCKRGHELTDSNVYVAARGNRTCKTCNQERGRQRYQALKAKRQAAADGE